MISGLLSVTSSTAPKQVAEIIQRIRPDVLLLNEFDYDPAQPNNSPTLFQNNFLSLPQNGQPAIVYAYRYTAPVNTGVSSGLDLNRAGGAVTTPGSDAYGQDCFGYGQWPGQYGMVIYSRYPLLTADIRTFQLFLWKNMPGAVLPDYAPTTTVPADYYSPAALNIFRLSSKSHWDVPVDFNSHIVHLLAHHPTPPVFDGTEDRNGRRNHDEIRLWADYLSPEKSGYITDDLGKPGGLAPGERFVIMGDHNADPFNGDSYLSAIRQLLDHPLVNSQYSPSRPNYTPTHAFGTGYFNDAAYLTAPFGSGQLRVDYVLPSKLGLSVGGGGVYWPVSPDPGATLVTISDHRPVYMDFALTPILEHAVKNLTVSRVGNDVLLQWQGRTGYAYTVQQAESLAGPWVAVPEIPVTVHPTTFAASATDLAPGPARKFYRIEIRFQ